MYENCVKEVLHKNIIKNDYNIYTILNNIGRLKNVQIQFLFLYTFSFLERI